MSEHQSAPRPSTRDGHAGLGLLPVERLEEAALAVTARLDELQAAAAGQAKRADDLERKVAELERQLAVAEAKLAVETMHSAGLQAQASHLLAVAVAAGVPALPELAGEGKSDGMPEDRLAQIYEAAFDAKGAEYGIEDPSLFRA